MIKVFGKIFEVLETVIAESPNPVTPMFISERLNMNRPTCSRILRDLTDAGYLTHISRQSGYSVGPRSFTFAGLVHYKTSFLEKARPYVKDCAFKLSQSILLCERKGMDRYILCHHNYSTLNIHLKQFSYQDLFETATGMVLLAHLPKEEQEEMYVRYREKGLCFFPEMTDLPTTLALLERTRKERFFIRDKFRTFQWIAAYPIYKNGIVIAALGLSAPAADVSSDDRSRMSAELKKTACIISNELSTIESIG